MVPPTQPLQPNYAGRLGGRVGHSMLSPGGTLRLGLAPTYMCSPHGAFFIILFFLLFPAKPAQFASFTCLAVLGLTDFKSQTRQMTSTDRHAAFTVICCWGHHLRPLWRLFLGPGARNLNTGLLDLNCSNIFLYRCLGSPGFGIPRFDKSHWLIKFLHSTLVIMQLLAKNVRFLRRVQARANVSSALNTKSQVEQLGNGAHARFHRS